MTQEELDEIRMKYMRSIISTIDTGCNCDLLIKLVAREDNLKPSIVKYVLDKLIDAELVFIDGQNMAYVCEFNPHRLETYLAKKHLESNNFNRLKKSPEAKTIRWNEYWANKEDL